MAKPGPCWKCKNPITEGGFLNIAGADEKSGRNEQGLGICQRREICMDYHAACFECARCMTNVYGKNFSPSGDWKIFCVRCDPTNDAELHFTDQRSEVEKKNKPLPLPREPQRKVDASSFDPPEPIVSAGHVRALAAIGEAKRQDKERQERFEEMQRREREETAARRQREIELAKKMKEMLQNEEEAAEMELRKLQNAHEEEERKMREEVRRREAERQARVAEENRAHTMTYIEEIPAPEPEPKRPVGRLNIEAAYSPKETTREPTSPRAPIGKINLDAFAPPPPPPPSAGANAVSPRAVAPKATSKANPSEDRGALLSSIKNFKSENLKSAPPPPPPPAKSGSPPPPPTPAGAPPVSQDRSALLNSIQGFNPKRLRSVQTNDRSAPMTNVSSASGEGATSPRGRGPPAGGMPSIAAMAAAVAAARR